MTVNYNTSRVQKLEFVMLQTADEVPVGWTLFLVEPRCQVLLGCIVVSIDAADGVDTASVPQFSGACQSLCDNGETSYSELSSSCGHGVCSLTRSWRESDIVTPRPFLT